MTVREFVGVVTRNPNLMELQLSVVTGTESVVGGRCDGGMVVRCRPVRSATVGWSGLLMFADTKAETKEVVMADLTKYPAMLVIGPLPSELRI